MIDVRDYGATGDGVTDDGPQLYAAVLSMHGKPGHLYFPSGTYRTTYVLAVPAGSLITGDNSLIVGKGFLARSNQTYRDLCFDKGTSTVGYAIQLDTTAGGHRNILVDRCQFSNYTTAGVYGQVPSDNADHENITVRDCYFTGNGYAVYAARAKCWTLDGNRSVNSGGFQFEGGNHNTITGNHVKGGRTGIAFVYRKGNGAGKAAFHGNLVHGNTVTGCLEESITFDIRGNDASHMAVREQDTVLSVQAGVVKLANPGWSGGSMAGYYMVPSSGQARGCVMPIASQAGQDFTVQASPDVLAVIAQGDTVTIGAPTFDNSIVGNRVDAAGGTPGVGYGIGLWGFATGNVIANNTVRGKGIWIASLNGLPAAGSQLPYPNGRQAPSQNNMVTGNIVNGSDVAPTSLNSEIRLHYKNYGVGPDFMSYGNQIRGNTISKGRVVIDRHEDMEGNNVGTFLASKTNLT